MSLNDDQVRELSPGECSRLLCSYPVIVAQHFSHRFNAFVNHILKGDSKPIEVVDFFWRVEFQQRGSPTSIVCGGSKMPQIYKQSMAKGWLRVSLTSTSHAVCQKRAKTTN